MSKTFFFSSLKCQNIKQVTEDYFIFSVYQHLLQYILYRPFLFSFINSFYFLCNCILSAFQVYTFVETVLDTLVLLPYFIEFFRDESRRSSSPGDIAILFVTFGILCLRSILTRLKIVQVTYQQTFIAVLNLAFALSLLCFIGMHASLVTSNTTSIEVIR